MSKPYLIQRIMIRQQVAENESGVDKHFSFDYMGSSEFEFGALSKALKAMVATQRETQIQIQDILVLVQRNSKAGVNSVAMSPAQIAALVKRVETLEKNTPAYFSITAGKPGE